VAVVNTDFSLFAELDFLLILEDCRLTHVCADAVHFFSAVAGPVSVRAAVAT